MSCDLFAKCQSLESENWFYTLNMSCTDSYVLCFPVREVQRAFLACIAVAFLQTFLN